jgi:hypothetical protein
MDNFFKLKTAVIFLFVLLIFVHFIPLSLHPLDTLTDTEDCVLNAWIPVWVQQQLFDRPFNLFDANIFYPHTNTLSYSEHLFPQAIVSLPIYLITKNPVAVYNFIFFFFILLNGFGMFLLTKHLTKSDFIGIACGMMFAFNTYQINQITHLQLICSGFIPLAFLFLHKFLEDRRLKNSILFALFFTLQGLACVYYGLFFISVLFLVFPLLFVLFSSRINRTFLSKLGIPLIFSGGILALFSLPYLRLIRTYGFDRGLQKGADLLNYLAVDSNNVFLSRILSPLGRHEHFLFPGIAAVAFALFFLFKKKRIFQALPKGINLAFSSIFLILLLTVLLTAVTGGIEIDLGILTISVHSLAKQVLLLLFFGSLFILLSIGRFLAKNFKKKTGEECNLILYLLIGMWTLFLSFGSHFTFLGESTAVAPLPFARLFNFVPGFKGIRMPSRFALFVIFAVAVLAAFGMKHVFEKIERKKIKILVAAGLFLFLNLEYLSIPHQMRKIPVRPDLPPAYQWIKDQPGDFVIVSLPFFNAIAKESIFQYFALDHKKKIINGYSGFVPPESFYIDRIFKTFPSQPCMDILRAFGVKYVVFHPRIWRDDVAAARLARIERYHRNNLRLIETFQYEFKKPNALSENFGEDRIYEVLYPGRDSPQVEPSLLSLLSPEEWQVQAGVNQDLIPSIKDGDLLTRWHTGRAKRNGDTLTIELEKPAEQALISLYLGSYVSDFALDLFAEVSSDGEEWTSVPLPYSAGDFAKDWIANPLEPVQNITVSGKEFRFIKLIQIGDDPKVFWSVAEMKVLTFSRP